MCSRFRASGRSRVPLPLLREHSLPVLLPLLLRIAPVSLTGILRPGGMARGHEE